VLELTKRRRRAKESAPSDIFENLDELPTNALVKRDELDDQGEELTVNKRLDVTAHRREHGDQI